MWDLDARLFLIDFLTGIDVTNRIAFLVEEGPDPYVENIYIYTNSNAAAHNLFWVTKMQGEMMNTDVGFQEWDLTPLHV